MNPPNILKPGEVPLEFKYKGGRDYVHGTDIYDAIVGVFSDLAPEIVNGPMSLTIVRVVKNQCILSYEDCSAPAHKPENGVAYFSFDSHVKGWLLETDAPVLDTRDYNEKDLLAGTHVGQKSISGYCSSGYRPIEVLVAMTKHLHEVQFDATGRKWLFTRLDLKRLLQEDELKGMKIELTSNMGTQITRSSVYVDDENIGSIYFSTQES